MNKYKITYIMSLQKNIEIFVGAKNEEEAIVFAKIYRQDPFKIEQIEKEGEQNG